jgi:preprotein translocase subunit SecG
MFTVLLMLHGFLSLCLIGLVLLQQGKGADMGATIGGGGSSSVFGGAGAVDFVGKLTTGLAIAFMCTSILLVRAYTYRAPSVTGTKSEDFLKGSLFDEADEIDSTKVSEATTVEEGSVKRQATGDVSQQDGGVNSGAAVPPAPADGAGGNAAVPPLPVDNGGTEGAGTAAAVVAPAGSGAGNIAADAIVTGEKVTGETVTVPDASKDAVQVKEGVVVVPPPAE